MRRAIFLCLVLMFSINSVSAADISTDTEWSENSTLSGDYVVKSGNTLTISGDYTVDDETNITVESGANLIVSGSLSSDVPTHLKMLDNTAVAQSDISVPITDTAETGTMKIYFAQEINFYIQISIDGANSTSVNGSEFEYTGDFSGSQLEVVFTEILYESIVIESIVMSPVGGTPSTLDPNSLESNNTAEWIAYEEHFWFLYVQGSAEITGNVMGAIFSCVGDCVLNGASLQYSSPIDVTGSISVDSSTLNGSRTDEDIMVWDDAGITWSADSVGTGGETDNWVNVLTSRTVTVPNGAVYVRPIDLGYGNETPGALSATVNGMFMNGYWNESDEDIEDMPEGVEIGDAKWSTDNCSPCVIDLSTSEHGKMVRWQDSSGEVHNDTASATFHLDSASWGNYVKTVELLPNTNNFEITIDLPLINIISVVASEDSATTNNRLGVLVTVKNSGLADANIFLECTTDGNEANIGSTVKYPIEAGQTEEIALNWDTATEGTKTLDCGVFIPEEFAGLSVGSSELVVSNEVSWSEEEDRGVNLIWPIIMGLGIGGVIYYIATTRKPKIGNLDLETVVDQDED